MRKVLLKYKFLFGLIIALMIIDPVITSVLNFWLQNLFNAATVDADKIHILRLLTIGFIYWMLKRFSTFALSVVKARLICNVKQNLKFRIFSNLMDMNASSLMEKGSSGEYISIFTNDINILEQRYFNAVLGLISNIFSIVILGSSFFALNSVLAIAIFAFGLIAMFVPAFFSRKSSEVSLNYSNTISAFTQKLKEFFVSYSTIKNYSVEKQIKDKFSQTNKSSEDAKFETDYVLALANNVGSLLSWFMQFIAVGLGLMLVIKGNILLGTVVSARSFASDLALPLQEIIGNVNSILSVKDIVKKSKELTTEDSASTQRGALEEIDAPIAGKNGKIVFENVSLNINSKNIINKFSFTFDAGKKYLVIGKNGSGKSSLFKTLKKWYRDAEGNIYIDDVNIRNMNSLQVNSKVSYLNENVSLLSGLVLDNITLYREYESAELSNAILDAQINIDLERPILDGGANISSGEQRRIEIARSLLKSANVLIFDEVISTLDIEAAYDIEKLIMNLPDKTVIFVSHNFSGKLVKDYDEILIIDSGNLVAHGSYDDLITRNDYFKKICEIKFGDQMTQALV